jgi:hypothetical protein
MNTWITNNAIPFSNANSVTLSPVSNTTTGFNLNLFSNLGMIVPVPHVFVSSVQMYINVTNPIIEFVDPNNAVIHTIQNTGRYTGTDLQTFDIPHVNMATVISVRIRSASIIEPNITWYGLQRANNGNGASELLFTGNFTFDTVPLMHVDNANGVTSELNVTIATTGETQITSGFIIQPNLEYNFNPFYLTIPTFSFTGSGTSTVTPVPFTLRLTQNGPVVTTVNFNLNAGAPYPNGIVIPLTNPSVIPTSVSNLIHTVTPTITTSPSFLRGTSTIVGTLTCSLNGVSNLRVVTRVNDNGGLAVRIFGTGVTIDPLFTPDNIAVMSPITFSPNKMITFPNIRTATDVIASNTMSYTIIQSPNIVTLQPATNVTQSFSLLSAFTQNNATITVLAHSRGARGLNPRSIFVQPSIFNYQNLIPGRVVPFVNTYNAAPVTVTDNSNNPALAVMNVTFTRNVVLNSLDFGYVFGRFLPASNVTVAGYAATNIVGGTATFTITLTSIPRIAGEPPITYGSVQFVCRPNQLGPTNAYRAIHNNTENQNSTNDGTLLSIPFTTTAMTPLPTFVNSFTPSVAGSNFTFNIGDQVRIEFAFNQVGNQFIATPIEPTQFLGIVQQPEMCGALMCTPNPPPPPPPPGSGATDQTPTPPSNLWFSTNNGEINLQTHTVLTETFTFDAPTILHGFRLTSFRLQGVTAVLRLRVTIFRNTNNVFQVYFDYSDWLLSGTTAPLFIPFSYAEFDRYAQANQANPEDVVRIVPTSIVFSRPQHPIFNTGESLRMEISVTTATTPGGVQSALSPQTIVYRGNVNTNAIAGRLTGIILSTPTITFPTLQMGEGDGAIRPGITPVFVGILTNPFVATTPTRDIPISIPTSNSAGAFTYTVTSQSVNPSAASGAPAPSISTIANNAFTAQFANNINSRFLINAWQRSSTIFTNGLATSTIDYINTSGTFGAYSTSPSPTAGGGGQNIQMINNPRPFVACIMENSAALHGFSFQFFGGYQGGGFNYTMRVWVTRGFVRLTPELTITFTTSVATTNRSLLDGTFAYIPFQQNVIQTPTHVSNVAYSGSLPMVQLGDFVRVSLTGSNSSGNGVTAAMLTTPLQTTSGGNPAGPMMGSLLIDTTIGRPAILEGQGALDMQNNGIAINANSSIVVLNTQISNANIVALQYIRLPMIELVSTPPTPPTVTSPHRMRVSIFVSDGGISIYTCEIVICIIAQQTSSGGFINIPFNMRMPAPADSTPGFFVESFNPRFNPDFFNILLADPETSTATHSFPRIMRRQDQGNYTYTVSVENMESSRQAILRQTLVLGTNIACTLGYINLPIF